jgi:hypothetical protein
MSVPKGRLFQFPSSMLHTLHSPKGFGRRGEVSWVSKDSPAGKVANGLRMVTSNRV